MDDEMIDLLADDGNLRQRLDAYAGARLSPDQAASARIRARVLAVAHRQSALAGADTTLALLTEPDNEHLAAVGTTAWGRASDHRLLQRGGRPWRRAASVLLAASLGVTVVAGGALAARPGGALYGARLWAETLTLPADPSARAVAELARLGDRLAEATAASADGDTAGASAALRAYESIMSEATANAVAADDGVASAALETGVAQNVTVLQSLVGTVPEQAGQAIEQVIDRAIERAIARSNDAIDTIHEAAPANGGGSSGGGQPTAAPTPEPTPRPTKEPKPTPEPATTPATTPEPTPKPTKEPTPTEQNGGGGRPSAAPNGPPSSSQTSQSGGG